MSPFIPPGLLAAFVPIPNLDNFANMKFVRTFPSILPDSVDADCDFGNFLGHSID